MRKVRIVISPEGDGWPATRGKKTPHVAKDRLTDKNDKKKFAQYSYGKSYKQHPHPQ